MNKRARTIALFTVAALFAAMVALSGAGEAASGSSIRSCRPFVISKSHDEFGLHRFRAWEVRRSSKLSCTMARRLLKAAYGTGPLRVIRRMMSPGGSGRPIYWIKGGWRCSNGAGGAVCLNATRTQFDFVDTFGTTVAVTASTG
jgi:hypothetical protein